MNNNIYSWVVPDIVKQFNISSEEALFLLIIRDFPSGKYGYCYKSQEFLAERMGISSEVVSEILKALKRKGFLQRSQFESTPWCLNVKPSNSFLEYINSISNNWIDSGEDDKEKNGKLL